MSCAPTFRDIQNMDDREIVRVMVKRQNCPCCRSTIGLEVITDSVHETKRDDTKGIRQLSAMIHCSSCGTLKTPLLITIPMNEKTYKAMLGFGERMKDWRPSQQTAAQAQRLKQRRIMIDPTKPWYPNGQSA